MKAGISGTREMLTSAQFNALRTVLCTLAALHGDVEIHHGCCTGADVAAHQIGKYVGARVLLHPGLDSKGASPHFAGYVNLPDYFAQYEPLPYRERNQAIVDVCDVLIAAPLHDEDSPQSRRSGTWQTVRMARRAGKPIIYDWRDGCIEYERQGARVGRYEA